ncbi:MAG: hypothetical protein AAF485_19140 [Chloroflexota bacterium]
MTNLTVNDVRVFVPAKDFEISKEFYIALGWQMTWSDENLAILEIADQRFYLQNYYTKDWAENFMLHISVDDATAWKEHASALLSEGKFKDVRVEGPKLEPYGALVTYVWDPSGVLLHFAQWNGNDP